MAPCKSVILTEGLPWENNIKINQSGPVFASKTNLAAKEDSSGAISETGIKLGPEDKEKSIVVETEKVHARNQRTNTKVV